MAFNALSTYTYVPQPPGISRGGAQTKSIYTCLDRVEIRGQLLINS